MQQSNGYIIRFTLIMTIAVALVLAGTNLLLKESQQKSIEFDTKSSILKAVMDIEQVDDILATYDERISSLVVDIQGNVVSEINGSPAVAEDVDVAKESKKDYKERMYPVFMFKGEGGETEAYIVPLFGAGLWDRIWGFVAISDDLETITGVSFSHKQETPGLGARIADKEIQDRYVGKNIYNERGRLVSVTMLKGENGGGQASIDAFADRPNEVDGLSGATLTAKGVNEMMKKYLDYYQKYFNSLKE